MPGRFRDLAVALAVSVLAAAACGNSSGDQRDGSSGGGGSDGGGVRGSEADRDTFEEISGVPGVTDDEITYAVIGVRSNNPLGTCILDCYLSGIQAYFDYRNAEGGIFGRDLAIGPVLDDELSQNQARSLEVTSSDDVFGTFDAPLVASGFGDLDAAGVPTYSWGIHLEAGGLDAVYPTLAPLCSGCTNRAIPYAASLAGATRVATLGYGASANSKDCANNSAASVDLYTDDIGAEVVFTEDSLEYGLPNGIGPEVTAMKDAGVDFVVMCLDLNGAKTLAQELDRQGLGDVPMYHPNTYDQRFVAAAGDLFEGDIVSVLFVPFEAERSGALDAFLTWMEKSDAELTELAMVGWINADAAYTALLAAGPTFDREAVISAMNSITDFDAGGLIVPIDWTRQHTPPPRGQDGNGYTDECTALVRVVDGAFEMATPEDRPWACWDDTDRTWSDPVPTNFSD